MNECCNISALTSEFSHQPGGYLVGGKQIKQEGTLAAGRCMISFKE